MKTLSVCMIVKNEARNLMDCLPQFQKFADEIIIVDHFSEDNTTMIAERGGAKVIKTHWIDDFGHSRNLSIESATGDLLMWLDADDRITDVNADQINELKSSIKKNNTAFGCQVVNILPDNNRDSFLQMRIWPNDKKIRWQRKIHEQISASIRNRLYNTMYFESIIIEHHGYVNEKLSNEKMKRNKRIIEMELPKYANDPSFLSSYGDALCKLKLYENAIQAYRAVLEVPDSFEIHSEVYKHAITQVIFCKVQLKKFKQALKNAEFIYYKQEIATPSLLVMMAELYHGLKNYHNAAEFYCKVINLEEVLSTTTVNYKHIKELAHNRLHEIQNENKPLVTKSKS